MGVDDLDAVDRLLELVPTPVPTAEPIPPGTVGRCVTCKVFYVDEVAFVFHERANPDHTTWHKEDYSQLFGDVLGPDGWTAPG